MQHKMSVIKWSSCTHRKKSSLKIALNHQDSEPDQACIAENMTLKSIEPSSRGSSCIQNGFSKQISRPLAIHEPDCLSPEAKDEIERTKGNGLSRLKWNRSTSALLNLPVWGCSLHSLGLNSSLKWRYAPKFSWPRICTAFSDRNLFCTQKNYVLTSNVTRTHFPLHETTDMLSVLTTSLTVLNVWKEKLPLFHRRFMCHVRWSSFHTP